MVLDTRKCKHWSKTVVAVSYFVHSDIFLQNGTDITKYYSCFITKHRNSLLQDSSSFFKKIATTFLLNVAFVTICDTHYKMNQHTQKRSY